MFKKTVCIVVCIAFVTTLYGCATIVHGTQTKVLLSSEPAGATAIVGNRKVITPATVTLKNSESYQAIFKKDGYEDAYYNIDREMSGWVWGNVLLGGIIGLIIDNTSGGAYKLVPTEVNVMLLPKK